MKNKTTNLLNIFLSFPTNQFINHIYLFTSQKKIFIIKKKPQTFTIKNNSHMKNYKSFYIILYTLSRRKSPWVPTKKKWYKRFK